MPAMTRLSDMTAGSVASLVEVGGERSFRRRLMELGFLPGTPLRLVRRVGIGNLLELEVRGCHLSLRCSDARNVFVDGSAPGCAGD
jgi:Fe2+ transport system protein FeoA